MTALHKHAQAMAAAQRTAAAHGTMARCSRDWECVESKNSTKKARSRQRNCANTVPRQAHVLILASCRQDNILASTSCHPAQSLQFVSSLIGRALVM